MAEVATANNIASSLVTEWKETFINGEESKELKKVHKQLEEKSTKLFTLPRKFVLT